MAETAGDATPLTRLRSRIRNRQRSMPYSDGPLEAIRDEVDPPLPATTELLTIEEFRRRFLAGELSLDRWETFALDAGRARLADLDPYSDAYADAVMDTWRGISGRSGYRPEVDETFELDGADYLARPFPFSGRDPATVGGYFGAVAHAVTLMPPLPATIVELGAGWGHLALMLAATGYDVTAVDLNPASVELLRRRAAATGVTLDVRQHGFLDQPLGDGIDAIVFFEAFHHCDRPFELLDRCAGALRRGGRLVFVAEAFYDDFYAPWGVRLDGAATFMTAQQGWLELGFDRSFIEATLQEGGFTTEWTTIGHLGAYGTFLVASLNESTGQGRST